MVVGPKILYNTILTTSLHRLRMKSPKSWKITLFTKFSLKTAFWNISMYHGMTVWPKILNIPCHSFILQIYMKKTENLENYNFYKFCYKTILWDFSVYSCVAVGRKIQYLPFHRIIYYRFIRKNPENSKNDGFINMLKI